eukprot:scaffold17575_cov33-Tisochrysis_lutea.AAC.2
MTCRACSSDTSIDSHVRQPDSNCLIKGSTIRLTRRLGHGLAEEEQRTATPVVPESRTVRLPTAVPTTAPAAPKAEIPPPTAARPPMTAGAASPAVSATAAPEAIPTPTIAALCFHRLIMERLLLIPSACALVSRSARAILCSSWSCDESALASSASRRAILCHGTPSAAESSTSTCRDLAS